MNGEPRNYEFGAFCLEIPEQRLLRAGQPVPVTPKIFELLRVLVENAGHLVEKEQLLKEVWPDAFVEEANLNRGISVLRKTLGETPDEPFIQTVPKRGYRFVAPVRIRSAERSTDEPPAAGNSLGGRNLLPPTPSATSRHVASMWGIAAAVLFAVGGIAFALLPRDRTEVDLEPVGASIHRQVTFSGKDATPALSPDGGRIAYVSNGSSRRKVIVQSLTGGAAVTVFEASEAGFLRWSPDGGDLLLSARGDGSNGLYLVSPSGGAARKIAGGGSPVACWSPDGSTIVVAAFSARKLLFLDRKGDVQRSVALKDIQDWIWDLDWSPHHDRLLFVADDNDRRTTVWTIRTDGTEQTRIMNAPMEILAARWAASGDALYYFGRVNQTVSLYKAAVDVERVSSDPVQVPLLSGLETDEGFGLSADGSRLVYARAPYYSNLWLVEADEDSHGQPRLRQTQLTDGTSVVERPHISPDGALILFSMGYESRANLYTIPATGGIPKQLTFLNAFSVGGVWSPDGRTVAFASTEGGNARVWTVNADGSSPRPVPSGDLSESYDLAWAPGNNLLYQQTNNRNFYVIDPHTAQQRLLIEDSSVGWVGAPSYSPDAKRMAIWWNRRPGRGIWLFESGDWSHRLLLEVPNPADPPLMPIGWSSDGAAVYVWLGNRGAYRGISVPLELTTANARVVKLPVSGGPPETIVSLPFDEVGSVAAFPDGRRFVASVYSSRSDIWVVDNFDSPSASARLR